MAKVVYFNKGTVRGQVTKSEIITYENEKGGGSFLSMEIQAGSDNSIKVAIFPSKAYPSKHLDYSNLYPVGTNVEATGSIQEKEYTAQDGRIMLDRSVSAYNVKPMKADAIEVATFILHGLVSTIKHQDDNVKVTVALDTSYEKDGVMINRPQEYYTLEGNVADMIDDLEVVKGCNAKFKGRLLNQLEMDDYGDITGRTQMFLIEKIENVVDPMDLDENMDEIPF